MLDGLVMKLVSETRQALSTVDGAHRHDREDQSGLNEAEPAARITH
jgi:hypothetical protein